MIMTAVYTLRLARKKKIGERISPVRVAYCLVYATEVEKLQDSQNGREKWVASATAAAIDAIHRMRSIAPIAMLLARSNHSDDYDTGVSPVLRRQAVPALVCLESPWQPRTFSYATVARLSCFKIGMRALCDNDLCPRGTPVSLSQYKLPRQFNVRLIIVKCPSVSLT